MGLFLFSKKLPRGYHWIVFLQLFIFYSETNCHFVFGKSFCRAFCVLEYQTLISNFETNLIFTLMLGLLPALFVLKFLFSNIEKESMRYHPVLGLIARCGDLSPAAWTSRYIYMLYSISSSIIIGF